MEGDPILVPCVGSGAVGHQMSGVTGKAMCPMCGALIDVVAVVDHNHRVIDAHDRDDILARINRGDFG